MRSLLAPPNQERKTRQFEALWLVVTSSAVVLAWIWLALRMPLPVCPFRVFTGLPCFTCGATRSFSALLRGNLAQAFQLNPLAVCAMLGGAAISVYAAVVLIAGTRRLRLRALSPREAGALRLAVLLAVALNWIYLIAAGV